MVLRFVNIWFCFLVFTVAMASGPADVERFYEPLDKLSKNPLLQSRDKISPVNSDEIFPFNALQFADKLKKIPGMPFDEQVQYHLKRLTGSYANPVFDALGIFAELDSLIVSEFTSRGVPAEYALLAPMLSGMNAQYMGPEGKRGVWQLDVVTAVRYGLIVSETRDDRDDPILSATAAASYLRDLMNQYKSSEELLWVYISSPAEVKRAYARARSVQLEVVRANLPGYLRHSRPLFSSWVFLWKSFNMDNLTRFSPSIFLPAERVKAPNKIHLGQIAEVMEIPVSELNELNPALKNSIAQKQEFIWLPKGKGAEFQALANTIASFKDTLYFSKNQVRPIVVDRESPANQVTTTVTTTEKKYHVVKSGETLSHISGKYNVSISSIKKWNNLKSSHIRAGQKLIVRQTVRKPIIAPQEDKTVRENVVIEQVKKEEEENKVNQEPPAEITPKTPEAPKPQPKVQPKEAWTYYTVKSGDTLYSIGKKYGVAHSKIKEWNGLRSDNIQVGQKLKIKK